MRGLPSAGRAVVDVVGDEPFARGRSRGVGSGEGIRRAIARYFSLFHAVGIPDDLVRSDVEVISAAIAQWSADIHEELAGVASGAGVEMWRLVAVNSRTEVLSRAVGTRPGECSTIAVEAGDVVGGQTWDWHEELDDCWHLQRVRGSRFSHVGLTEYGILAKVGLNSAGVGVMLNILAHHDDQPFGVPIHLVCARVLAEAGTLSDALEILTAAPVTTSSAITVLTPTSVSTVELSPCGTAVVDEGMPARIHTNHFLDPRLGEKENSAQYGADSVQRFAFLRERIRRRIPATSSELLDALGAHGADGAEVCCHPAPDAGLGQRWATLATVTIEPSARRVTVFDAGPLELDRAQGMDLAIDSESRSTEEK